MRRTSQACVPDEVAQHAINQLIPVLMRDRARYLERFPLGYQCPVSGERSLAAIGTGPESIAIRVGLEEDHHWHSGGCGVKLLVPTAINRIARLGEYNAQTINLYNLGLCDHYLHGIGLFQGIVLARIGLEP